MGNTLSKLLVGSVISISLTSNGILINGDSNKFDRAAFEKTWKEFLRNQAIERGLDVSKYYKGYSTKSVSRSILMDANPTASKGKVQTAIDTATPLNEQLYTGIPAGTSFKFICNALLKAFKSLSEEIQEGKLQGNLQFNPEIVDFKTNDPPSIDTANVLGVFAKIIWTKSKQKGVAPQYNQFAQMMNNYFSSIPGDSKFSGLSNDQKSIYGHFYFGKAQVEFGSDEHDAAIASVDIAVQIAEQIGDQKLKYRALETKARSLREKRGEFLDKSYALSQELVDKSEQDWVIAYALNNMDVLFKRGTFNVTKEEKDAIAGRSLNIRKKLGDLQGVASSNGNKGKRIISGDNPQWAEAFKLHELARDWRVSNEDTWGVAGSDFTIGKYLIEMNQKKFGGPIFYGMAIRKFITALKLFQVPGAKLGYSEVSEYFAIILNEIHKYEQRKHNQTEYENEGDTMKAKQFQQEVLEDAKVAVKLTLFFRSWGNLGLEKDFFPTLKELGFIGDEQLRLLQSDENQLQPIQAQLTVSWAWRRDYYPPETPEQQGPHALKVLEVLLEKYKQYGLDPDAEINYFNVLDARDEVRNENYKGIQILALNFDDYMIGRTYFDMAGTQYWGLQGGEHVGKGRLEMLGAIKFYNVLDYKARLEEIGVKIQGSDTADDKAIHLFIKRALEGYGSSKARGIQFPVRLPLMQLLERIISCQSICINKKDCHCTLD